MNTASKQTLHTIERIVKQVPIGTNLGLLQLIWTMIRGTFLPARGAVHTALMLAGFKPKEIRRSWQALRYGVWSISELVSQFHAIVEEEGSWQANEYGGYQPIAVDVTAIWRPQLKSWKQKVYRQLLGKAVVGIGYGLIARVGTMDGQRIPLLTCIVRGNREDESEVSLKEQSLKQAARQLAENEVLVHDGGAKLSDMHQATVERYVIRLASNCTGRRNQLPPYKGKGPYPSKGVLVRPLERTFKGKAHAATPEDEKMNFQFEGRTIGVRVWRHLVRADLAVSSANETFSIWEIDDPLFEGVLLLGTNLPDNVSPQTIYQLYIDRWPVEQIPLVAKQLLGCHRQFVFATVSCWRLGELAFFVGNLLTWLALCLPAFPSGYWDRHPKKRPVALDGSWPKPIIQKSALFLTEFARKPPFRPIYPKVLRRIGGLGTANPFPPLYYCPYC